MANIADSPLETMTKFYKDIMLKTIASAPMFHTKYKNVRVPSYLTIKVPVIYRHKCEYDDTGWILTLKEIRLFKIGSHIEKVAYYSKKNKEKVITFKRYSPLSVEERQPLK